MPLRSMATSRSFTPLLSTCIPVVALSVMVTWSKTTSGASTVTVPMCGTEGAYLRKPIPRISMPALRTRSARDCALAVTV